MSTHGVGRLVVCWTESGDRRFVNLNRAEWSDAQERFEAQVARLAPEVPVVNLRARYLDLGEVGGGIPPQRRMPVGLFHAHHLEPDRSADSFACVHRPPMSIPLLGPSEAVERRLAAFSRLGAQCDRYMRATAAELDRPRTPPSDATYTVSAEHVLTRIRADPSQREELLKTLRVGEIIWLVEEARRSNWSTLARRAADLAVARRRSSATLNVLGAVLRDSYAIDRSIEIFRESIALTESAERNPFGYVGLAVSLRRKNELGEAWDVLKRPRRHYPDDPYVVAVTDALARDLRGEGTARPRDYDFDGGHHTFTVSRREQVGPLD